MTNLERRQVLDRTKALQSVGINVSVMDTLRNPGMLAQLEQQASTGQTQEIATTEEQQMQGLQDRPPSQIPDQYVMKDVAPNSTIHTKNVKAPLDIDYKDPKTGHLVESYKSVQPGTVLPGTPHNQSVDVVESPAKSMMRLGGVRRKFQNAGREEFKTGVGSFVGGTPIQDASSMPITYPGGLTKEEYNNLASMPETVSWNAKGMTEDKRGNWTEYGGDKLSQYNEPSGMSRLGNILANPMTSFAHSVKGEQIPGNMQIDGPNRNILDNVIDLINPAAWTGYAKQADHDRKQGNYKEAGMNVLGAIPGVAGFGKTAFKTGAKYAPKIIKPFVNAFKKQGKNFIYNTSESITGLDNFGKPLTRTDRILKGTKGALAGASLAEIPGAAPKIYNSADQELAGKGNLDSRLSAATSLLKVQPGGTIINKGLGKYGPGPDTIIKAASDFNKGDYINSAVNFLPSGSSKYLDIVKNTIKTLKKQGVYKKFENKTSGNSSQDKIENNKTSSRRWDDDLNKWVEAPKLKTGGKKYKRKRRPIIKGYRNRLQQ